MHHTPYPAIVLGKVEQVDLSKIEITLKQKGKCFKTDKDTPHRKVYEYEGKVYKYDDPLSLQSNYWSELLPLSILLALNKTPYFPKTIGIITSNNKYIGMVSQFINGKKR